MAIVKSKSYICAAGWSKSVYFQGIKIELLWQTFVEITITKMGEREQMGYNICFFNEWPSKSNQPTIKSKEICA